jgi:hypothetical protein
MTFAKKRLGRSPKAGLRRRGGAPGLLLRALLFGALAIAGAAWALARHYTHPLPPMRVPRPPAAAPTYDADAGEIPVPELLEPEGQNGARNGATLRGIEP